MSFRTKLRSAVLSAFIALFLLTPPQHAAAQEGSVSFESVRVQKRFGEEIVFLARIRASQPISEIALFFREADSPNTNTVRLQADAAGNVRYRYELGGAPLRPFGKMLFWYQVQLSDGSTQSSRRFTFMYDDDRFPWQSLEEDNLRVHWYAGDNAFGQAALDAARAGLSSVRQLLPYESDSPLDVYIYDSPLALQSAIGSEQNWVAGHASPALGVVLLAIPPGETENMLMRQRIPHEIAHVMLYRHLGERAYNAQPIWLLEGMATLSELYPNPDYPRALERARDARSLIPLADLCTSFPLDASQAFLAYAEANSFTRYLYENYGISGLEALLQSNAQGLNCDQAAQRALGTSLTYLDRHWQEAVLGVNPYGVALRNGAPYLGLLFILLAFPLLSGLIIWRKGKP